TTDPSTDITPIGNYSPPKSNSYKGLIIVLGSIAIVFVVALILLTIGMFKIKKKSNDNDDNVDCGSSDFDGERNSVLFSNINIESEWLQHFENSVRII
ncbi:19397_t:CDS:1, partial [Entrophospora sp. SA101]